MLGAMHASTPRPSQLLTHPLWLAALAVLVVNDHLLKGAGLLPTALTGKLSDVAGLVVAPALLATLLRLTTQRALFAAHLAIGLVFSAINLSPAAAGAFESLMALGPLPWHITVDPTDLLTLPALALSWRLLTRPRHARAVRLAPRLRRPLTTLALSAGLTASVATSPPPEEPFFASVEADLFIAAASDDTLILRMRPLREGVVVDCAAAARDPSASLSRALFDDARAWRVEPERAVVAHPDGLTPTTGDCHAVLVDGTLHRGRITSATTAAGQPIPMVLLFWTSAELPPVPLTPTPDELPRERLVRIARTPAGARWEPHATLFPAPPETPPTPLPGCEPAPAGGFIDWQDPPPDGPRTLAAITSAPDGCHRLTFDNTQTWYLCTGTSYFPFAPGDPLHVSRQSTGQSFRQVDGLQLLGTASAEGKRLVLARGPDLVPFGRGDVAAGDLPECRPTAGPCGNLVIPQEIILQGLGDRITLISGDSVALETGTLVVHRAERIPIGDHACLPTHTDPLHGDAYAFESVFLSPSPTAE